MLKKSITFLLVLIIIFNTIPSTLVIAVSSIEPCILYRTHVQDIGWQGYVADGKTSGTTGQSKRLEGINIKIEGDSNLGVQYTAHVQDIGWQSYVTDGSLSGTTGQAKRLEAIKINLTGADADLYDVFYRVHVQDYGWLGWAENGNAAGTEGLALRLEAIEIKVVLKSAASSFDMSCSFISAYGNGAVSYRTHVENFGWQNFVSDGEISGTTGQSLRLEGINIRLHTNLPSGNVVYSTHVQDIGWMSEVCNGQMSGTTGQSKRLEAIRIRLEGKISEQYDIYYRVHVQNLGWMGWAKNGESAGTAGFAYRLEGIQIVLVSKGSEAPGSVQNSFIDKYHTHSYTSKITTPATCTKAGIITYTCTVCGETYTEKISPTGKHSFDGGKITTPATCTKPGIITYTCTKCGETYTKEIPPIGHTEGEFETVIEPTITSTGLRVKRCTVCGEILEQEIIPGLTGWDTQDGKIYYYDSTAQKVTGWQTIGGLKYYFDADGLKFSAFGIDVSKYQDTIDWNAVKASGVDFAMIRLGYRGYGTGALVLDSCFLQNVQGAKNAGIDIGVYFFSQAITTAEAVEEANMVLAYIKNNNINLAYPIAFDTEDVSGDEGRADSLSAADRTDITIAFCKTIKNAGFVPMVYSYKYFLVNCLEMPRLSSYPLWLAEYANVPTYSGIYNMWQYTSSGTVGGISGQVDLNVWLN